MLLNRVSTRLSERDPEADICLDAKGKPEPDAELRNTETVALPSDISLPLPLGLPISKACTPPVIDYSHCPLLS